MKTRRNQGFTLIELLVVITIIAILASIAVPAYNGIQNNAQRTKALSNAKQIALASRIFASEEDGRFPVAGALWNGIMYGAGSNGAFDQLIDGKYLQSESIFYVAQQSGATEPNNDITAVARTPLLATETGWAYVNNMTDSNNPFLPLVVTRDVGTATWGDTWDGRVILVSLDYSGRVERINAAGAVPGPGAELDLFNVASAGLGYPATALVVEPL